MLSLVPPYRSARTWRSAYRSQGTFVDRPFHQLRGSFRADLGAEFLVDRIIEHGSPFVATHRNFLHIPPVHAHLPAYSSRPLPFDNIATRLLYRRLRGHFTVRPQRIATRLLYRRLRGHFTVRPQRCAIRQDRP